MSDSRPTPHSDARRGLSMLRRTLAAMPLPADELGDHVLLDHWCMALDRLADDIEEHARSDP